MKENYLSFENTVNDFVCKITFPTTYPIVEYSIDKNFPHRHYTIEVQYVVEGNISLTTYNPHKIHYFDAEEIIIIPANQYHIVDVSKTSKRFCFFVSFTPYYQHNNLKNSDFLNIYNLISNLNSPIIIKNQFYSSFLKQCKVLYTANSNILNSQITSFLTSFFLMIINELSKNLNITATHNLYISNAVELMRKEQLEQFFCDVPFNNLTIKHLASKMHLSERQVHSIIKKNYNTSYKDIVLTEKMKLAKIYLKYTDKTLEEISYILCYNSYSGFYTAFKKYFHCSPESFRKENNLL